MAINSQDAKLNQRPVPDAALRDSDAVEMLRVWIAERGLHCSMKVGMYRETMGIPEEKAWGVMLADVARHVANALEEGYSTNAKESLRKICESMLAELGSPTSDIKGDFLLRH